MRFPARHLGLVTNGTYAGQLVNVGGMRRVRRRYRYVADLPAGLLHGRRRRVRHVVAFGQDGWAVFGEATIHITDKPGLDPRGAPARPERLLE